MRMYFPALKNKIKGADSKYNYYIYNVYTVVFIIHTVLNFL